MADVAARRLLVELTSPLFCLCTFLTLAAHAHAAPVLYTSELTAIGRAVSCAVLNTGSKDAQVVIEVIESTGEVKFGAPITAPPGRSTSIRAIAGNVDQPHCRVTITKGGKKTLRASLCVHEGTSSLTSPCIATSEAR